MFGFSRRRLRYFVVVAAAATSIDLGLYLVLREIDERSWREGVDIAPGATRQVTFEVSGTVEPGDYRLRIHHQPLVTADSVAVQVTPAPGWALGGGAVDEVAIFGAERFTESTVVVLAAAGEAAQS